MEGALAEPVGRQPRVDEHWSWPVPWLAEVQVHRFAQEHVQQFGEIRRDGGVGEVVALPLDNVGGKARGRSAGLLGEKRTSRTNRQPMTGSSPLPIRARRWWPMRARICSTLPAPLASPKNSHASETFSCAESQKNPRRPPYCAGSGS